MKMNMKKKNPPTSVEMEPNHSCIRYSSFIASESFINFFDNNKSSFIWRFQHLIL